MIYLGGIIAAVLAVSIFFGTRFLPMLQRERVSSAFLGAGSALAATGGFYISTAVGYFVVGGLVLALGLLFGFDGGR